MSNKWKSRLLAANLEFETAKVLVQRGFAVTSDFTYSRVDSAVVKDFSVDIRANLFTPHVSRKRPSCSLDVLVECKQRTRRQWLFYPDPNQESFSLASGETVRGIDEYSRWFLPGDDFLITSGAPLSYKAVEIDPDEGFVQDAEFRHGIFQLQYALPRLLAENIKLSAERDFEDYAPFLVSAVLVTNAELILAHRNLSAARIEKVKTPRDLGRVVPFVSFYAELGTEFQKHCSRECADLAALVQEFAATERYRIKHNAYTPNTPSVGINALVQGGKPADAYFSRFIVCNFDALSQVVLDLKQNAARRARQMQAERKITRKRRRKSPAA